jgi:hypothetical protein
MRVLLGQSTIITRICAATPAAASRPNPESRAVRTFGRSLADAVIPLGARVWQLGHKGTHE